ESESASTTAQATGGDEKGSEGKAKAHPEDDLPAWAKDELSRTRREAARYRTERNELRTKLEGAKTPDEVQALVAEYEQKAAAMELDLVRERVARANGLPDELAEVLKGTTEDELKAHAEVLKKFASGTRRQASGTGSGGLDPTKPPEKFDAKAAAQGILARRSASVSNPSPMPPLTAVAFLSSPKACPRGLHPARASEVREGRGHCCHSARGEPGRSDVLPAREREQLQGRSQ